MSYIHSAYYYPICDVHDTRLKCILHHMCDTYFNLQTFFMKLVFCVINKNTNPDKHLTHNKTALHKTSFSDMRIDIIFKIGSVTEKNINVNVYIHYIYT